MLWLVSLGSQVRPYQSMSKAANSSDSDKKAGANAGQKVGTKASVWI